MQTSQTDLFMPAGRSSASKFLFMAFNNTHHNLSQKTLFYPNSRKAMCTMPSSQYDDPFGSENCPQIWSMQGFRATRRDAHVEEWRREHELQIIQGWILSNMCVTLVTNGMLAYGS